MAIWTNIKYLLFLPLCSTLIEIKLSINKNCMKKFFVLISIFFSFNSICEAIVKPNSLFADNMVLQQGIKVPVWGKCAENEVVIVEFCGQTVKATTKEGKWFVQLNPLKAGGPYEMIIKGQNTVKINNVLVGEVWICSGQSNMAFKLGAQNGNVFKNDIEDAQNYPRIRQYVVPQNPAKEKVDDANGKWFVCDNKNANDFSAVGYFFAKSLARELKVPVGLLFSAVGGSNCENWTSRAVLENTPELQNIVADYEKSIIDFPSALLKFRTHKDSIIQQWRTDSAANAVAHRPIYSRPSEPKAPQLTGKCGGFFNGMIYPLIPFAVKGVIWYQGENDIWKSKQYQTLFPSLIADWRKRWNIGDFPFLFVQLPPHQGITPEIREAQLLTWKKTANTSMVVTVDCGDSVNMHPLNKKPVGQRLALAASNLAYKQNVAYSGPIYRSMEIQNNTVVLSFDFVNKGLVIHGNDLRDFEIAGADKKYLPAKAIIKGNKIIVSSDKISNPVAVRMGWKKVPYINLYNADGLPASPFRTDVQ